MFQDGSGGGPTESPLTLSDAVGFERVSTRAVAGHACAVHPTVESSAERRRAAPHGRSSTRRRARAPEAVTEATRGRLPTFQNPGLLAAGEPVVALCPRKVRSTAAAGPRPGGSPGDPEAPTARRLQTAELNFAGRLCGSTRLPLGGFTYS